jgi:transketolase
MMAETLKAAQMLADQGVSAEVVSFHTVKPLDNDYLQSAARRFRMIATIEEHGCIGGFGGAVAEWRAKSNEPIPHLLFGTGDEFMHEVGGQTYARAKYGLTAESIARQVMAARSHAMRFEHVHRA